MSIDFESTDRLIELLEAANGNKILTEFILEKAVTDINSFNCNDDSSNIDFETLCRNRVIVEIIIQKQFTTVSKAIKMYKDATGVTLIEAKRFICDLYNLPNHKFGDSLLSRRDFCSVQPKA